MLRSSDKTYDGGKRLTFCDLCKSQKYVKDVFLISDRFSLNFGMLACRECYSPVSPQDYPRVIKDDMWVDPRYTRTEAAAVWDVSPTANILPSAPKNIRFSYDATNDCLRLDWYGPDSQGSSNIIGYKITRASPQLSFQFTIEDNTDTNEAYYIDVTSDINTEYSYVIYAINSVGIGAASEPGYYPRKEVQEGISYIFDGDGFTILDGLGGAILDGASA